ncbi:wsv265 [White spot syndrome virus]|uniref:Wsv265 n=4 Tax=White spot syndrome virus TaxID=342409 RepID=Q8VAW0_WSSVS|nr:wsv265 [Shrimp white spot syndrome virus]AFX59639.1 wsv265 [White spot syndrome virus]AAL33268.1 wsv265 [Shrimp white spot syndrome virus]AWQ62143.1 wsv265 [Shrimp white spot syndrome virus]AWQ62519.1 wsv265 [Shrimp white spot syndrome virus]WPM03421.1 hypothetical protein wsv265 [White spot syndrome virus]
MSWHLAHKSVQFLKRLLLLLGGCDFWRSLLLLFFFLSYNFFHSFRVWTPDSVPPLLRDHSSSSSKLGLGRSWFLGRSSSSILKFINLIWFLRESDSWLLLLLFLD